MHNASLRVVFRGCSPATLSIMTLILALLVAASLWVGESGYTLPQLLGGEAPRAILEIRVARTVAALSAGVVLAAAGLLLQYALRNPLADPYLLGVSPAAILAVSIAALTAPSIVAFYAGVAMIASLGGLAGLALTLLLSRFAADAISTILAGVAVSTMLGGAAYAVDYLAAERLGWPPSHALFGGFGGILPEHIYPLAATAAASTLAALIIAPRLEALLYGDDAALLMGVEPRAWRLASLIASGVTVSVLTGYTGVIGFVGLIAPNAARKLTGCIRGSLAATASMIIGASVTLSADIAARLIASTTALGELPAGALIAVAGGAMLAAMLVRQA